MIILVSLFKLLLYLFYFILSLVFDERSLLPLFFHEDIFKYSSVRFLSGSNHFQKLGLAYIVN